MHWSRTWHDLIHMDIPPGEKALRTILVYAGLVILVRIAGKRVLSQLNTFDLVVVLLLSNVVQNAVIGPDNSLAGGLLGAAVLIGVNALWERLVTSTDRTSRLIEGTPTVLVRDGEPVHSALNHVGLRLSEVMAALHRQGADRIADVKVAQLEPGGSITMELTENAETASYGELRRAVDELRAHLDERMSALETALASRPAGGVE